MNIDKKLEIKNRQIAKLKEQIASLTEERDILKYKVNQLQDSIDLYIKKNGIAESTKIEFNKSLDELISIKHEYTNALNDALALKKEYKDLFKQLLLKFRAER